MKLIVIAIQEYVTQSRFCFTSLNFVKVSLYIKIDDDLRMTMHHGKDGKNILAASSSCINAADLINYQLVLGEHKCCRAVA